MSRQKKKSCKQCLWTLTKYVDHESCRKHPAGFVLLVQVENCPQHEDMPEYFTMAEAEKFALVHYRHKISRGLLIKWCRDHGMGRQFAGRPGSKKFGRWRLYDLHEFKRKLNAY